MHVTCTLISSEDICIFLAHSTCEYVHAYDIYHGKLGPELVCGHLPWHSYLCVANFLTLSYHVA